jgi:hypothetical protein
MRTIINHVFAAIGVAEEELCEETFWAVRKLFEALAREGRSSSCSMTCTERNGVSRPRANTSPIGAERRQSSCFASRGPSCSIPVPGGAAGS